MNWDRRAEDGLRSNGTVRRVRQIGSKDCGVAAVAMIADVTYTEAHAAVGRKKRQRVGTSVRECWDALERLGVTVERAEVAFRSWQSIDSDALVMIRWRANNAYHWVVYQRRPNGGYRILDPSVRSGTLSFVDEDCMRGVFFCRVGIKRRGRRARRHAPAPVLQGVGGPRSVSPGDATMIGRTSVTQVRASSEMRQAIHLVTGLSLRSIGARLRHPHGRTLVRNVFADVWPPPAR